MTLGKVLEEMKAGLRPNNPLLKDLPEHEKRSMAASFKVIARKPIGYEEARQADLKSINLRRTYYASRVSVMEAHSGVMHFHRLLRDLGAITNENFPDSMSKLLQSIDVTNPLDREEFRGAIERAKRICRGLNEVRDRLLSEYSRAVGMRTTPKSIVIRPSLERTSLIPNWLARKEPSTHGGRAHLDMFGKPFVGAKAIQRAEFDTMIVKGWALTDQKDDLSKVTVTLIGTDHVFEFEPDVMDRPDVSEYFGGGTTSRCGFIGLIRSSDLPTGKFRLYIDFESVKNNRGTVNLGSMNIH